MPTYDFECQECGNRIEAIMPISQRHDTMLHFCKICRGERPHDQIIVPPAFEAWSDGRFFEHLGPKGMTFYDKSKYREHLKREGLREWSPKRGMPGQEV